jgi:hypothetical protein
MADNLRNNSRRWTLLCTSCADLANADGVWLFADSSLAVNFDRANFSWLRVATNSAAEDTSKLIANENKRTVIDILNSFGSRWLAAILRL